MVHRLRHCIHVSLWVIWKITLNKKKTENESIGVILEMYTRLQNSIMC